MPHVFLTISPELIAMSVFELKLKFPHLLQDKNRCLILKEGIEIKNIDWIEIKTLIYYLKIPTRMLLRVAQFKCRDFPTLYKKVSKIPWHQYIPINRVKISASAHNSRLIHSKRIEKSTMDAIEKFFIGRPPNKKTQLQFEQQVPFKIYVRLDCDLCTISLDLCGDPLYQRGTRVKSARAPLRETIASSLLLKAIETIEQFNYSQTLSENLSLRLIDPMSGSGTFLTEALQFFEGKNHYDNRSFSIEKIKPQLPPIEELKIKPTLWFSTFLATEIDRQTFGHLQNNLLKALNEKQRKKIKIYHCDFSKIPNFKKHNNLWDVIICNPPYNNRIKIQGDLIDYYQKMISLMQQTFKPQFIAILLPISGTRWTHSFKHLQLLEPTLKIYNGGIVCTFYFFKSV